MRREGKLNRLFRIAIVLGLGCMATQAQESNPYANETVQQREERMAWWHEARFGMFIHWGIYSLTAGVYKGEKIPHHNGSWIMMEAKIPIAEYKAFAKEFNPVKYDPDAWVCMAKDAGMKYIVITAKHHDGFALFDSKATDWDVVDATPYGKDLLVPLAEACRRHGMKLGFYYSHAQDWVHPGAATMRGKEWDDAHAGDMDEYIKNIAAPQVREILTNYGDIAVLWWDSPRKMEKNRADILLDLIKLQPGIITNNRLTNRKDLGDGYTGDYGTPEQRIPATGLSYDWESCMTMNGTWGFKTHDHNWKSTETLLRNLIDIASKGGNYLLNVGPTAEGEFPEESIERLREIGVWMKANGESIYGTTASPFRRLHWGRCTKKIQPDGAQLYLHVFRWPTDGKLYVPGLHGQVVGARLLDGGGKLETVADDNGVTVSVPIEEPNSIASVIVLEIEGELDVEAISLKQADDGMVTLPVDMADLKDPSHNRQAWVEGPPENRNIGHWHSPKAWPTWAFKIDRPGTFKVVAEIASPSDGNRLRILGGRRKVPAKITQTGSQTAYQQNMLGLIEIREAGVQELSLRPVKANWKGINLRAVHLIPTEERLAGAEISWSSSPFVNRGHLEKVMGTSQFDTAGTLILADNCGGSAMNYDGIAYTAGSINMGKSYGGFHSGNSVSDYGTYNSAPGAEIITLGSGGAGTIVSGKTYRVQLLFMDGRSSQNGMTVAVDGVNQGQYSNGEKGVTFGDGLLITGTFTADSDSQIFDIEVFDGVTRKGGQLNALLLYETDPDGLIF